MFSQRSAFDPRPNRIAQALAVRRARGEPWLDLTLSNPTHAGFEFGAWAKLDRPETERYEPAALGLASAREAVAAWMTVQGAPVEAGRVVLCASTSEAYALLFQLLCDPGDAVLAPRPSYPLLEHLARFEGVAVQPYTLDYDDAFHLTPAALAKAHTQKTRAAIAVHPNNPTGSFVSAIERDALLALDLPLISDEVFAPYALEAAPDRLRSLRDGHADKGLVFSLHGLSKLGLPQLKLSWICVGGAPEAVDAAIARLEWIADARLSVATPVQLALPGILDGSEARVAAIRSRLQANLAWLRSACVGSSVTPLPVEGGWYATLRLPAWFDDEAWCLALIEEAGVLTQPGYYYDFERGPCLVLSLLTRPDDFAAGVQRLLRCVESRN